MIEDKTVLARILEEVKAAECCDSSTTAHNSYTSGVFEDENKTAKKPDDVLARVLAEVRAAELNDSSTTAHNSYTSGVFEDDAKA
ncbi:MAG: hypothetical protein EXS10_07200 [Phycisphaerales bacterium]|nr:hypothetical protein [Phycisphaerales bacterium]